MSASQVRVHEVRVSSWNELNDALFEGSLRPSLGRHRSPFAYRGQADARHGLETSLMRMGDNFERLEGPMLRAFRKYAPAHARTLGSGESLWNWLALAQHHGLPTRLLDFSYSPLVALHFATRSPTAYRMDCAIWCIDYVGVATLLPEKLRRVLDCEEASVFTVEMLESVVQSLADLERLSDSPFAVFLEPPSFDERIVNQYALFATMSNPRARIEEWMAAHAPELLRKIVIPAELTWEVRDKLDQTGMNERVLFPGLDGLSRWLKRYYTPLEVNDSRRSLEP